MGSEEKLMPCPRDAAIHAVALIEMDREGTPHSRSQEEFYNDAAEVVDAVLKAMIPTPAADEVEAVARALARRNYPGASSADIDEMREGFTEDARAAIAAMQARPAEPAGEEPVAWMYPAKGEEPLIATFRVNPADYGCAGRPEVPLYARPTPSNPERLVERRHSELQYLQEVADGAYGDGPMTRGAARDALAAAQDQGVV